MKNRSEQHRKRHGMSIVGALVSVCVVGTMAGGAFGVATHRGAGAADERDHYQALSLARGHAEQLRAMDATALATIESEAVRVNELGAADPAGRFLLRTHIDAAAADGATMRVSVDILSSGSGRVLGTEEVSARVERQA